MQPGIDGRSHFVQSVDSERSSSPSGTRPAQQPGWISVGGLPLTAVIPWEVVALLLVVGIEAMVCLSTPHAGGVSQLGRYPHALEGARRKMTSMDKHAGEFQWQNTWISVGVNVLTVSPTSESAYSKVAEYRPACRQPASA